MDASSILPGETPPRPASAARSPRARARGVVDDVHARALRAEAPRALRDLLAAFDRADALTVGRLLAGQDRALYPGLVTVLLRLLVILFAEAHGLLPLAHPRYAAASLTRLRADLAALDPARGGALEDDHAAWARVTALFRLLHDGLPDAPTDTLPARGGHLFAPDAYPFLEGRPPDAPDARGDAPAGADLPRLPGLDDAAVRRVLDRLLAPGGEPLQYRDLEVEHLGSFYEGLLGFEVQIARGPSLALQPHDAAVDLEALLARPGDARLAFLRDAIGLEPRGKTGAAIAAATTLEALAAALSRRASPAQPDLIPAGARYLQPGEERRRLGAHYTTREITRLMVHRALAPLLRPDQTPEAILALRICDPAMGSGAFLVEACRQLADHLVRAAPPDHPAIHHARRLVAQRCLYGVDRNPVAVDLARLSLWLVAGAPDEPLSFVDHALRHGDALLGLGRAEIAAATQDPASPASPASPAAPRAPPTPPTPEEMRALGDALLAAALTAPDPRSRARVIREIAQPWKRTRLTGQRARPDPEVTPEGLSAGSDPAIPEQIEAFRRRYAPFHWELELPEVFAAGGFDAFVGNPPWVAYVGRAAQPIADELRDYFTGTSPAFSGYRTLQGLFVHRAATLLRPGGRLGLVLPTSMSDLSGYEPARRAHDALCACDDALPDFGDRAFEGVFQPSMGLLSTRRADPAPVSRAGPWPLARSDLDPDAAALLDYLCALPPLPPHLFGERGFQTTADDVRHLRPFTLLGAPDAAGAAGATHVRTGSDIEPFLRRPPRFSCDPAVFGGRFRPEADWKAVRLLIRQTARYPIAALSDGAAFRNSILAGFADERHSEHFLLAWLNSTPIRWFHYMRHRDARQGMPQVKIAHLRALPAPPADTPAVQALAALGRALGERNAGITPADQEEIDRLAADALALDERARAKVAAWRTGPRP